MNKRGMLIQNVIFILLNLTFCVAMIIYISTAAGGKYAYEQAYAKQIALLIDEAKPNMTIMVDMQQALDVLGNKASISQKNKAIFIDNKLKTVTINLGSIKGYSFKYFTEADIVYTLVPANSPQYLIINITNNKNAA